MLVYRITQSKHAYDIFGTGAALFPGRWNKMGQAVLYTGANPEIALLEVLVHASNSNLNNLDMLMLEIPDNLIAEISISDLPSNWAEYPAPTHLAEIASKHFIQTKALALKLPSSIIRTAHIVLLNCSHQEYKKVVIKDQHPFILDKRLIQV